MMNHVLDNPIWNALISKNSNLSLGDENIKYFPGDIAPFAGLKDVNQDYLKLLFNMLPGKRIVVLITAVNVEIPSSWKIINRNVILQMVAENPDAPNAIEEKIVPLEKEHVPQMLALTKLANPGPFSDRTIEFGNYSGIFKSGHLVAMAGQRFHLDRYAEISAVCTHPDYMGNGYGSKLILQQAQRMMQQGDIPFLHVRANNAGAIKLYKALGFITRQEMNLNVIQK
ncbi:MAG: GNAT family N-acetyltransferase [Ginsengibacter sp.]